MLDGLPVGPVPLIGRAEGGVLVRNPFFNMTFTVPSVTRRSEPFKLFATVTNIGQGIGNDVTVTIDASRLSGATLVGSATQQIDTLRTGDARTVSFDFIAGKTGKVVASYLHFDPGAAASGDLKFALAVDERGVALSPDTLVLPTSVDKLPPDVVDAAMRVLGQAWSNANAPAGTLPAGVLRIGQAATTRKVLALAEAGLRMTLGQSVTDAVRDIAFDFYGGDPFDAGFDQLLRQTEAGHELARSIGAALADAQATGGGIAAYEHSAANIAASGSDFISFAVGHGSSAAPVGITVSDAAGRRTTSDVTGVALSEVRGAVMLPLAKTAPAPVLGVLTAPSDGPYTIELLGRNTGPYELSVTVPVSGGTFIRGSIAGAVTTGSRARVLLDPARPGGLTLEEDLDCDGTFESSRPITTAPLVSSGPRLVAATMVGPETVDGSSPFGFGAALLFDRRVGRASAATADRYQIPRNTVQAATSQLSGRLVFASLNQPEGPTIASTVRTFGIADTRGTVGPDASVPLQSLLKDPGAVVSGHVVHADGTPVTSGMVTYVNNLLWTCPRDEFGVLRFELAGFASVPIGADGRYEFRFVRQDTCGLPWQMVTSDPSTGAVRSVSGYVRAAGEQIVLDIALLGQGTVTGIVRTLSGATVPGARVTALSDADEQNGGTGISDGNGRYTISGVTVGQISVAAAKGTSAGRSSGRLSRIGTTTTIDVTLDGGTARVSGIVRQVKGSDVSPIAGITVVYALKTSGPLGTATTNPDGRYDMSGLPVGDFTLTAALNKRNRSQIVGVATAGEHLTGQDLVITIPDTTGPDPAFGTVRGTVRFAGGAPAPGALVSIAGAGVLSVIPTARSRFPV